MSNLNYSLYKGVWVFNGRHREEVRLTKEASQQLLFGGGIWLETFTLLIKKNLLAFGML